MRASRFQVAAGTLAVLSMLGVACGGTSGGDSTSPAGTPSASEDERGSIGVPPTAAQYCVDLGFTLTGSGCTFHDGTRCDEWAFYDGKCGQAHSYCNQHGGVISSKTVDMGTWTAVYGVCTVAGKQCDEGSFIASGHCP